MEVKAKTKNHPDPVAVEIDIPTTLDAMLSKFGEDVVTSAAKGALVITAQAAMRRLIEKGSDQATIQSHMDNWNPSVRDVVRQTAFEKATAQIGKLSPEERAALLKKLQTL